MPLNNSTSVQEVCDLLNEILRADYECTKTLISHRVKCNTTIANHPTVQVQQFDPKQPPMVGLLGFLNGLFGIREDGMGAIIMELDDDDIILRFVPTPDKEPS